MTDTSKVRKALLAAIFIPAIAITGLAATTDYSLAQQSNNGIGGKAGGGNNDGGRGGPERSEATSGGLDAVCLAAPCRDPKFPPRTPPLRIVQSGSIKPDCTCEMRTVRSGGRFIKVQDCYKVSGNRIKYCEPLAQ